jgi:hypothetical protein
MNEYKQQFDKNGYVVIDDFIDKNIQLEIKDLFTTNKTTAGILRQPMM